MNYEELKNLHIVGERLNKGHSKINKHVWLNIIDTYQEVSMD